MRPGGLLVDRVFDVTIAGELNLDLILYGLPDELSPEREILAEDMILTLGSSSAIVAHNLAALGSRVGFVSCIGQDQFGQIALGRISDVGVDVSRVRHVASPEKTGLTVILQRNGWRNILTYGGTIFSLGPEDLDLDYLSAARHFHLSSFFLQRGLRRCLPRVLEDLKNRGLTVSLDPNDDPEDKWEELEAVFPFVDVLLPNVREAKRIARTDELPVAVSRLAERVPLVVVKMGAEGAMARRGKEQIFSSPVSVDCVDPVGAGDSFDAGFLSEFLQGKDLQACLAAGNVAGAFSTTRAGGTEAFRDRNAMESFFSNHGGSKQGR